MDYPATKMELNEDLDILGSLIMQDLYTQICFAFAVAEAASHSTIINTLTKGLERVSAIFPWVAGKVVNESSGPGNSGIYKIKSYERTPRLVVKDLRDDPSAPTMDSLRQRNFPFSMLDESKIAPRNTLPNGSQDAAPVFLLQATFIFGGLLLAFVGQHNMMDMTGQGQIIGLISKACRNEPFTPEEVSAGNLARGAIVQFLDDSYEPGPELDRHIVKAIPSEPSSNDTVTQPKSSPPPKCSWAYFVFSPGSLTAVKDLATKNIPSGFISTDDSLSAFIWQGITRARLPRLENKAESTFARAVDVRRYLNVPPTYTGLMQSMTFNTSTVQKLASEPLGSVASQLRSVLDPKAISHTVRALATILNRTADKTTLSITGPMDLSVDIMLSSWSKLDCYDLDFGLGLGKPVCVRRPQFTPVESLIYLMPKTLEGEIAVGMCLREEDMDNLRKDEEFTKYATYIG